MRNFNRLEQELQEAQQQLQTMRHHANDLPNPIEEWQTEAIAEFSFAVEKLDVALEELRSHNEELSAARQEVELERQHYQKLFEFAPDGYLVTDERATIQEANCAAANLLNIPKQDLVGKPLDIFIALADRDAFHGQWMRVTKLLARSCSSQECASQQCDRYASKLLVKDWEILLQPREREPLPVALSLSATCNRQGKIISLCWLLRDLSDRQHAEQKIREQAALLDITTDAIFVRDLGDRIRFWNKGAERLYGWSAEEVLGRNVDELLNRKPLPKLAQIQQEVLEKGRWQGELPQVTKDGEEIVVESRWNLARDEQQNPKSILVVNTDITSTKQLQEQLLRTQRLESLGTLASGISHDLNNILTPILGIAQLLPLKFPEADEHGQQMFKVLETNAKRGAALLKQILAFSRGVEGKHVLLAVRSLVCDIEQVIRETFPKSIAIHLNIPRDLWAIRGDLTQLEQVLMNLCLNARDAMPNGGTLAITAENLAIDKNYAGREPEAKVGSYVAIAVSDTGIGMSAETLERIFEPFFTTKAADKGTGLGLATTMGIIKSHGGFIKVSSEVGKGTQFAVFLPAEETRVVVSEDKPELPRGDETTILIVDDEPVICHMIEALLRTYGYRVLTATDGVEAIAMYAQYQHKIGAILMDMVMPSMDGPTTILALQKMNPQVKIIVTSGLVSSDRAIEALGASVKAYLGKPYTSEELLTTLNEVLDSNSDTKPRNQFLCS
ncbi:MAG: PAS domain S-box protein [Hydrococcus sp. C42_A2020_068]|nr:PAS domain S-box protein [Hydrococcus sp. C42_A2020_068]